MEGSCALTHSLNRSLVTHARWLALGPRGMAAALALPAFELPTLPGGASGGASLTPSQVRAYAALYYYAELAGTGLMEVAELLPAERDMMRITDAELYRKLEQFALEMRGEWYGEERRAMLFHAMLGIGEQHSIQHALDAFTGALVEVEQALRYPAGASPYRVQAALTFAADTLLRFMESRAAMGLERAATVLNRQLRKVIDLLSTPALLSMFRVNSLWALLRQVAVPAPGGRVPDLGKAVTRATAGSQCLAWLAERTPDAAPPTAVLMAASNWQMNRPEGLGVAPAGQAPAGPGQNPYGSGQSPYGAQYGANYGNNYGGNAGAGHSGSYGSGYGGNYGSNYGGGFA